MDLNQIVQGLQAIREQQAVQSKALKSNVLRDLQAAAASPTAAVAAWEEAVRLVQFQGAAKEGSQFREWKDKEGEALREPEAANAAQMHFRWMALTLQRSMGTPVRDLLPALIAYTKDLTSDLGAMEALGEEIRHEKELAAGGRHGANRKGSNDDAVRRMHDQILRAGVTGSLPAQALKITDLLKVEGWENSPGSAEGIFTTIILPEMRTARDPRLIEYWDMKLKREAESATRAKLSFEIEKFNQVRRPELVWLRAKDLLVLGQRNRAITEMYSVLKAYPLHPLAAEWMKTLEAVITPPASAPPLAAPVPPTGVGAPGVRTTP